MRRHFLTLLLGAAAAFSCSRRAGSPAQPQVQILGRFLNASPNEAIQMGWSQTAVLAQFTGNRLGARMQSAGANWMAVQIDDQPPRRLSLRPSVGVYPLADHLGPGPHRLRLTKLTEACVGEIAFFGLDLAPGGQLLPPPPPLPRRLEFVGDSITAGYGNEGKDANCVFSPSTENVSLAYGPLAARALGAEASVFAWSGKGVWRNNDGTTALTLPDLYERILPERPTPTWSPGEPAVAAVVVNLGTNDFARRQGPVQDIPFLQAYRRLLQQIRRHQPKAYILCTLGPMLSDAAGGPEPALSHARRLILQAIDAERAAAGGSLGFLEYAPQTGALGYGCDYHPNLRTHSQMAAQLTAHLRRALGWAD
jgi:lysophospholipase L1-like esterase